MAPRTPNSGKLSIEAEDLAVYKIRHQQQQARSNVFSAFMFVVLILCVSGLAFGGYHYLTQQQALIAVMQQELEVLNRELAISSTEGTERDVSTLSSVHETKRQLTQLANQVKEQLDTYSENSRIRIDTATEPLKTELSTQKQEIDNLDQAITDLESVAQAISNEIASVGTALSQGFFDEIEKAQLNMAESVRSSNDRLRGQIEVIDQQQGRVVEVLGVLQENQERFSSQIAVLRNDTQTVRALLETEDADFTAAIESLNRFRAQTNTSIIDLRRLLTDINTRLTQAEQEIANPTTISSGDPAIAIPAPPESAAEAEVPAVVE